MKKRLMCILWFGFSVSVCLAQPGKIDSLKGIAGLNKEDTNAVNALNLLSIYAWQTSDYSKGLEYADKARLLAIKLDWQKGISAALDNTGIALWYKGNYPEALKNHLASLKIKEALSDKEQVAVAYNNIAIVYLYQENFTEAIKFYSLAKKIFEERCGTESRSKDIKCLKGLAACFNNLGNTWYSQGKMKKALESFLRSLEIRKLTGIKQDISASYNNLGILYEEMGDDKKALDNYNMALQTTKETGDKAAIIGLDINLGSYYVRLKNPDAGRHYLIHGLELAKEIGSLLEMKECYSDLAILDSSLGNYKASLNWYKLFISARDSLINEENTKKTVRLEMNYEFEKKEAAAKLEQEKKEAVAEAERRKQRIILWAISGFGLLVLGFALFAYRSFLQKKKANIEISRQKHLIEEKQKEILDSIHYAKRIQTALIPSEWYIQKQLKRMTGNA